jgi:hypothetical protein
LARLRSDFWVAAYIRQCMTRGKAAMLVRRGAAEAGAIFVRIDRLDGRVMLYGPALQSLGDDGIRRFRMIAEDNPPAIDERIARELKFDSDLWLVDVEDRDGSPELELAQD